MPLEHVSRLITARNYHQPHIGERSDSTDRLGRFLERSQVIGHRSKTLRLTPDFLELGMDVGRKFPHFADEPLQRARRRRPEQAHDMAWNAGCAAREECKA